MTIQFFFVISNLQITITRQLLSIIHIITPDYVYIYNKDFTLHVYMNWKEAYDLNKIIFTMVMKHLLIQLLQHPQSY